MSQPDLAADSSQPIDAAEPERSADSRASLASGSIAAFLSLGSSAVLTAALTLVLIRVLGRAEYGVFALALSIHQVALVLSDVGLTSACARELARVRDLPAQLPVVAGSTLAAKGAASLVSGAGLALLAPLLADLFDVPPLEKVLLVTAAALTLNSVFQLFRLGLNSLGATWQMFGLVVFESVVEVIASLTLVLATATAFAAMSGRIVGYGCGFALGLWLFTRRTHGIGRPSADVVRRVFSAGVFIGIAEGVYILFTQVDTLLIGAILGPASVAQFEAPVRILIMAGFVGYSLGLATMPRLAGATDMSRYGSRFGTALRLVACLQSALIAPWLVLIAPNATLIFGDEFASSSDVLYALTPYFFLTGIAPLASLATIYAGGERQRIVPNLIALGVNAGVTLLLLEPVGIVGAAVGVNLGSLVYVALFLTLCSRLLSIPREALLRVVLVPLAAGAVVAACAVGAWLISPALGVLALIPALGCHVAILRATGMLGQDELAHLARLARHPLRLVGR